MWRSRIDIQIQEELGEGGQGRVFKALRVDAETELSQTVAVKILHSRTAVDVWKKEFESLSRVRSIYCVQVHAFERVMGRPALVLEYVDGVALTELAVLLSDQDIEEIIAQVERGLLDLQAHGLAHGDLSPNNVMVDVDGRIRLLDFGLANSSEDCTRLTPDFAAPELLSGESASLASDLFSLGRIEQFLRGRPVSNDYQNWLPESRLPRQSTPAIARQKELGLKVSQIKEHRLRKAQAQTQTVNFETPCRRPWWRWFIQATCGLVILTSSATAQHVNHKALTFLSVQTHRWHELWLNDKPLGYAPVSLELRAGQKHRLKWRSSIGEGELNVTIAPGKSVRLTDRDFSH